MNYIIEKYGLKWQPFTEIVPILTALTSVYTCPDNCYLIISSLAFTATIDPLSAASQLQLSITDGNGNTIYSYITPAALTGGVAYRVNVNTNTQLFYSDAGNIIFGFPPIILRPGYSVNFEIVGGSGADTLSDIILDAWVSL